MAYFKGQPFLPQFVDVDGTPLALASIRFYLWNTTTPTPFYTDEIGTAGGTSVTLDVLGQPDGVDLFFDSEIEYKIEVVDQFDTVIETLGPYSVPLPAASLASDDPSMGASMIGYYDPVAPAYLKTVSDIINGEEVSLFRFIPTTKHEAIYAGSNSDDLADYFDDAFNGVASSGRGRLRAPAGTYNLSNVVAPAGFKSFRGAGMATKFVATGTWADYTPWFYFNGCTDVDIGDFSLDIDKTTYDLQHALYFGTVNTGLVSNIRMYDAGYIGMYMPACTGITVDNIRVDSFSLYALQADTSPSGLEISNFRTGTAGTGHSISIIGGIDHNIHGCRINGTPMGSFGISLVGASESKVHGNIVRPTYLEGIQMTDGHRVQILGNQVLCASSTHTDMGISLSAEEADVYDCLVEGNSVYNSGAPGIGLASDSRIDTHVCERNTVQGNTIFNPNRQNNANYSGIWVYGSLSGNNTIRDNEIHDQGSNVKYGCSEYNNGDGAPAGSNKFFNNTVRGSGLLGQTLLLAATSERYDVDFTAYTPTVTSTSGTITTASASMHYKIRGKFIEVQLTVTITTNGTGAGAVLVSTPWTTLTGGSLNGRAGIVSGKQVNGSISSGTNLVIYNYDNTYPGASTEVMALSGVLELS